LAHREVAGDAVAVAGKRRVRAVADGSLMERSAVAAFGWPARMLTRRAAEYTGRDPSTLTRAVRAGELMPAGRNGRSLTFDRGELDRWLAGASRTPQSASPAPSLRPSSPSSGSSSGSADALARLRAIARGTR
jgi:hypothetical protein